MSPDGGYDLVKKLGIQDQQVAHWLISVGYQTAMFGKYTNGYNPKEDRKPLGWDRFTTAGYTYEWTVVAPGTYRDEVVKDNSLRWLKESLRGTAVYEGEFPRRTPPLLLRPLYRDPFTDAQLPRPLSFNENISDKPQHVSHWPQLTDNDISQLTQDHRPESGSGAISIIYPYRIRQALSLIGLLQ